MTTTAEQKSTNSLTASAVLIRPEDVERLAACPALDHWIAEIEQRTADISSTSTAP